MVESDSETVIKSSLEPLDNLAWVTVSVLGGNGLDVGSRGIRVIV